MATTLEVAKQLTEFVKANKGVDAVESLYADDIVSVEAMDMGGHGRTTTGKTAVLAKNKHWIETMEIHSIEVNGPWPHDDRFIIRLKIDTTARSGPMAGKRMTMEEACLYTVKDDKIVNEEFFYHMGG